VIRDALEKLEDGSRPDAEFEYISSHLSDFAASDFADFALADLSSIFFSDKVRVTDESSVFKLVMSVVQSRGVSARFLLHSIAYEYLTLSEMIDFVDEVAQCEVTGSIFYGLLKRLTQSDVKRKYPIRKLADEQEFSYVKGSPFNGLFASIRRRWKKNAHEKGIVNISASDGSFPSKVTNYDWVDCWHSKNIPNSWLQFDFFNRAFSLTQYSIRTFIGGPDSGHLKNWVIEGSNNEKEWVELDRRENNDELNDRNKAQTFQCQGNTGIYRYIRLRQFGLNHNGSNFLFIGNVELFGAIY
jgi:hypothetical protein